MKLQYIDTTPLDAPVSLQQVLRQSDSGATSLTLNQILIGCFVAVYSLVLVATAFTIPQLWLKIAVALVGIGLAYWIAGVIYRSSQLSVRIDKFTALNGLDVRRNINPEASEFRGSLFSVGHSKQISRLIMPPGGGWMLGDYLFVTGSGKSQQTHVFGFFAVPLAQHLPNIILDARSNNIWGMSNLPIYFDQTQKMQLEGDFDTYFDVYCPKGYERDALYVLTPELMAILVDNGSQYDIEIVDNMVYFYRKDGLPWQAEPMKQLFQMLGAISDEIIDNSNRYRDERVLGLVAGTAIAPQGRRLKQGTPVLAIVIFVLFIVWIVWL